MRSNGRRCWRQRERAGWWWRCAATECPRARCTSGWRRTYEEEGAERWPLYRRYEVVQWSADESASTEAEAGRKPASRAEEQPTACGSDGEADVIDAQGTFEQAPVAGREAAAQDEVAAQDEAASAAAAGSGDAPARSVPSISDDCPGMRRRVAKRHTPSQRGEALAYAAEHGVSAAATKLGMSRPMVYAWRKQQERPGRAGAVADRGAGSGGHRGAARSRDPGRVSPAAGGWDRCQIQKQLRRRQIKVAVSSAPSLSRQHVHGAVSAPQMQ
jgi:hypothetical protein